MVDKHFLEHQRFSKIFCCLDSLRREKRTFGLRQLARS